MVDLDKIIAKCEEIDAHPSLFGGNTDITVLLKELRAAREVVESARKAALYCFDNYSNYLDIALEKYDAVTQPKYRPSKDGL